METDIKQPFLVDKIETWHIDGVTIQLCSVTKKVYNISSNSPISMEGLVKGLEELIKCRDDGGPRLLTKQELKLNLNY